MSTESLRKTSGTLEVGIELPLSTSGDGDICATEPGDEITFLPAEKQIFEIEGVIIVEIRTKKGSTFNAYPRLHPSLREPFLNALKVFEEANRFATKDYPSIREKLSAQGHLEILKDILNKVPENSSSHFLIAFLKNQADNLIGQANLQTY